MLFFIYVESMMRMYNETLSKQNSLDKSMLSIVHSKKDKKFLDF